MSNSRGFVRMLGRVRIEAVRIRFPNDPYGCSHEPGESGDDDNRHDCEETIGCVAEAEVSYACRGTTRRLERLQSGGVWGVCDADRGYRCELAAEELADLKNHLGRFGVVLDTFDALAEAALASVV